eukprot:gene2892-3322_t
MISYKSGKEVVVEKEVIDIDHYDMQAIVEQHDFPHYWRLPQKNNLELVDLEHSRPEHYDLVTHFKETLPSMEIINVKRVQNKEIWRAYDSKMKEMMKHYGTIAIRVSKIKSVTYLH